MDPWEHKSRGSPLEDRRSSAPVTRSRDDHLENDAAKSPEDPEATGYPGESAKTWAGSIRRRLADVSGAFVWIALERRRSRLDMKRFILDLAR